MKKKIVFLLPGYSNVPVGGYKVIFEYANRLLDKGYDIHLLFPFIMHIPEFNYFNRNHIYYILKKVQFLLKQIAHKLLQNKYFLFRKEISIDYVFSVNKKNIKSYNDDTIFFATAVTTAYILNKFNFLQNRVFYLIQDFENWQEITDEQVYESFKFHMNKITISSWLYKKVTSVDTQDNVIIINNGLDFQYFTLTKKIEERKKTEISMLYHLDNRKRCIDAINALNLVKEFIPDLHVTMFGTPAKPTYLPDYFDYYQLPDQKTHNMIYNNSSIFVAASEKEGMALPPAEAMICGNALCCTNIEGFSCYAIPNVTVLTSPVYDIKSLANNIISLINNTENRIKIAKSGNEFIKQYTWDKAVSLLDNYIKLKTGKNKFLYYDIDY